MFSSDLHGNESVFEHYTDLLRTGVHDLGILGGALVDEWRPDDEVIRLLGVTEDGLLDEIPPADEDPVDAWRKSRGYQLHAAAREARINELQSLLGSAKVLVLVVLGNHDFSAWPRTEYVRDIHMDPISVGGWPFIGYRRTTMDRSPEARREDVRELSGMIKATPKASAIGGETTAVVSPPAISAPGFRGFSLSMYRPARITENDSGRSVRVNRTASVRRSSPRRGPPVRPGPCCAETARPPSTTWFSDRNRG